MKLIIETTKPVMLHDPIGGQTTAPFRPCVVSATVFMQGKIASGVLKLLKSDLPDAASDEEFAQFLKDSASQEQAIEAFASQFEPKAEKPARAPRAAKKDAE